MPTIRSNAHAHYTWEGDANIIETVRKGTDGASHQITQIIKLFELLIPGFGMRRVLV